VPAAPAAAAAVASVSSSAVRPAATAISVAPPALQEAPVIQQAVSGIQAAVAGIFDTLSALVSALPGGPFSDFLAGALLMVRRTVLGETTLSSPIASTVAATVVDPNQHVLLIGVDGTDLSKILEDPYNQAFFDLMDTGTTAASTMVGHTTISAPGWTGILTGVWSETAGVSNNVFTPWTYDTWPTVFNQLEAADPTIATTVVANWEVIAQIAGAGSIPADTIVYYPLINDSWEETDDAVGSRSIEAIQNTVAGTPSFQMTYFVGVDNSGHDTYGAGSPEYAAALRNVNDNIASIMAEVDAWEAANPGEEWTVIAVTDHGQVLNAPLSPIVAGLLAHGFQSPLETTPFIIANGPDFGDGVIDGKGTINNTYSQVDITPTVLKLFGLDPEPYSAGTPLMDKAASDYQPVIPGQEALKNALNDALGMYGYPDVATNLRLGLRTLAATVPYAIYTLVTGLADPGDCSSFTCVLFEVNSLPEILAVPILFFGAVIYQVVNIPVQIIVRLTGVTGNSIIPPQFWPYYPVPGTQPAPTTSVPATIAA
ncbi:MAG: alkaline phosphatase family protein, partial [Mycobacterium sp.]|nr:alkaline phosphatase family protein [Mycobacterium sp.]